jgi:hypothetical protein
MTRPLALLGFLLGAGAVALQFSLSIPASMANGAGLAKAILLFVSFLTIISNTALVLVYLSALTGWSRLSALRKPVARGTAAAVILLVFLYYHLVLGPTKSWEGSWYLANLLLHYVAPLFYLVWWVLAQEHGKLRWRDLPAMALVPLAYLPYALALGTWLGAYPYPILDLSKRPLTDVLGSSAIVAAGLALLCALIILADRTLPASAAHRLSTKRDF